MDHNMTSPTQLAKRLFYLVYLILLIISMALITLAILLPQPLYFPLAGLAALSCLTIRSIGIKHCDFLRLSGCFPHSPPKAPLPDRVRQELEQAVALSQQKNLSWQQRLNLRKKVTTLLELRPEFFDLYEEQIRLIHPVLTGRMGRNRRKTAHLR